MMGEVSLETSPKNIMIQDMINSETVRLEKMMVKSILIVMFENQDDKGNHPTAKPVPN